MRNLLASTAGLIVFSTLAAAQLQTLTLEVSGVVDGVDNAAFPNVSIGDPYTAAYTIEYDPLADHAPASDAGEWHGPATISLQVGPELIEINAPVAIYQAFDDFFGFNDLVSCNISGLSAAGNHLVSLSFLDTSKLLLTDDSAPSEATLNAFPIGVNSAEFRVFNMPNTTVEVINGHHTSATFKITTAPLDPPETLHIYVEGTLTSVNQQFYPSLKVGEFYSADYEVEYQAQLDLDPGPDAGEWIGPASVLLQSGTETIQIGPRSGVYSVDNDFFGFNDLVQGNVGDTPSPGGRLVSLSFLDTSMSLLIDDSAPTEAKLNMFPLGVSPEELRVFDINDLVGVPLITGSHTLAVFTIAQPAGCAADLNNDGFLDSGDISAFVTLFLNGDLAVDFNNDGFFDSGDINAFVYAFLAGC